ncbi:MAG: acetolactate synthase small subunit, partial [Candidatus Neomarinimicrobiota bacterium]|nr:acetolactate synthase small subunit [Candidatus Neomarinimicrobiota bacterium]
VIDATEIDSHIREYALVKVALKKDDLDEVNKIVELVHGKIIDGTDDATIFELTGYEKEVESVIKAMEKYNILEIVRSGKVAMVAGNSSKNQPELTKSEPNWTTSRILESY